MKLCRPPRPQLRPFIDLIWATEAEARPACAASRELVLPTGVMHIVFRLGGHPLRLFTGADDDEGSTVGSSVLGGVRAKPYLKDVSDPGATVGIMLRPGTRELLSAAPAGALAGAHTRLGDIWPRTDFAELGARLWDAPTLAARLIALEDFLARRLPPVRGIDPLIAQALERFDTGMSVRAVVQESGFSHRHFATKFKEVVGLGPKTHCRILRFNRVLGRFAAEPDAGWADLALAEGYADQAHMVREFHEFAGVTPGYYRRAAPPSPHHVPA